MTRRFSQRGYPASWIDHACELALKKTRSDLLKKTVKKKKKFFVTCINQHSTHSNAIWSMFRKHWYILKSDSKLGGKNMRDHLVRAIFNQEENPVRKHRRACFLFRKATLAAEVVSSTTVPWKLTISPISKKFPINCVITCASTHVICTIHCPCGLACVGKTTRKLKQRISECKSAIHRNDRDYPIVVHFNDAHHDISSLRFCGNCSSSVSPTGFILSRHWLLKDSVTYCFWMSLCDFLFCAFLYRLQ